MVRRRGGTPGGYDPGGGSDDGGSDTDASAGGGLDGGGGDSFTGDPSDPPDPDPEPDPEPTTPAGPGLDPGTGGGGGSDDNGGGGGGTPAGPGLDPGTGGGASDPSPEPETTRLDQLAQRYTDTVAEPVGEAVGDATPAAQIEQATLGTNRLERTFGSAGETIAQAGNLPGIAAGARDTAQTLDQATSTAYDPVTIGGVPTGVRVPDPEGQQEVGGDAAAAGAGAAASAAESPFETAGTAIGAAALGVGGSRAVSQVSRRAGRGTPDGDSQSVADRFNSQSSDIDDVDSGVDAPTPGSNSRFGTIRGEIENRRRGIRNTVDDVESTLGDARDRLTGGSDETVDAVPSGRSQVGTGGRGSVLDPDTVDAERGITVPSRSSVASGRAQRFLDDQRQAASDFLDAGGSDRGQLQIGRQRSPDEPDFGDAPDRTRPADAGGTFEDVRQDALTQIQDDLAGRGRRPDFGDYEGAPQPFRSRGGDTIDADAGVQLERSTATPDLDVGLVDDAAGASGGTGTGATLGSLSAVNDPSGVADVGAVAAGTGIRLDPANDPTGIATTAASSGVDETGTGVGGSGTGAGGTGVTGGLGELNDPTGITDGVSDPTGVTTGTTGVGDTDTTGTTTGTDTGTGTDGAVVEDLRAATRVGTQERTAATTGPAFGSQTVTDPTAASDITPTNGFGGGGGFGFGGGTTRIRRREEPDQEPEDEPLPFALGADADKFGSGIASGSELADDLLQ